MASLRAPLVVRNLVTALMARQARTADERFAMVDLDDSVREIIRAVEPYTLTSAERIASLCASVDYVIDHDIPGAFVECGLWRGGSLMAILLRLRQKGIDSREVVGFDTFEGEYSVSSEDVDFRGAAVASSVNKFVFELGTRIAHIRISRDEVLARLASTGYPSGRLRLVEGLVEETLPLQAPDAVALLRLDTDYYESTRHELEQLYPRISIGGVMIIDDYGHFRGSRKAVDEYLEKHQILLHRVDYSCRLAVKQMER